MNCPRCDQPIDQHQAGPETDACVAVVVMGWIPDYENMDGDIPHFNKDTFGTSGVSWDKARKWSLFIKDAWEVVEKMSGLQLPNHVGPTMLHRLRQCSMKGWGVIFCSDFGYKGEFFAPTPELAICRAALEALSR